MADRDERVQAHPLRDRVLAEFQRDPASPSDVARRLGLPLNLVSYHTHVLVRHGYLDRVRLESRRGARYYQAKVTPFIEDDAWLRLSVARRRELALSTVGRLAAEARDAAHEGAFDSALAQLSRSPVELDLEGRRAVAAVLRETFDRVAHIAERPDRGTRRERIVAILAFELRLELSPSAARSDP